MGDTRQRRPLADVERELGRPCEHTVGRNGKNQWGDYCRACSNMVSQRRIKARERKGSIQREEL